MAKHSKDTSANTYSWQEISLGYIWGFLSLAVLSPCDSTSILSAKACAAVAIQFYPQLKFTILCRMSWMPHRISSPREHIHFHCFCTCISFWWFIKTDLYPTSLFDVSCMYWYYSITGIPSFLIQYNFLHKQFQMEIQSTWQHAYCLSQLISCNACSLI